MHEKKYEINNFVVTMLIILFTLAVILCLSEVFKV